MAAKLMGLAPRMGDDPKPIGERSLALARETKGTWLYTWENAPADTPDWAKKWYLLKTDYPTCPGKRIKVAIYKAG